jgi:hypothetical protein
MSDEGQRIEFGDKGPYLMQCLDVPDQAMLLEDHPVCLFQFGGLYLPVGLDAGRAMAEGLSNMSQASMGPEREGMQPLEFDLEETVELPLVTGAADESFQFGETVYMDVHFGDTVVRLSLTVPAAAALARVLSEIPDA